MEDELLPIKIVFRRDEDYEPRGSVRTLRKTLGTVTQEIREQFARQVADVNQYFSRSFKTWPGVPAIARVQLIPKALAKSHRPHYLFNSDTCPVVGGGKLGELYVSVSEGGLNEVRNRILNGSTSAADPSISTLEHISPFTSEAALQGLSVRHLVKLTESARPEPLKVRLFLHRKKQVNEVVQSTFKSLIRDLGIRAATRLESARGVIVYQLDQVPPEAVEPLSRIVGIQSFGAFPRYRVVRTTDTAMGTVSAINFPPPLVD